MHAPSEFKLYKQLICQDFWPLGGGWLLDSFFSLLMAAKNNLVNKPKTPFWGLSQ
jgi:hypothetical protein